jgi:hypothetical protein
MLFLAVGLLTTLAVWTIQRQRVNLALRVVLVAPLLFIGAFIVFLLMPPVTLGTAPSWYDKQPWKEVILFITMTLGMSARYMTKAIEARRERIEILRKEGRPHKKTRLEFDAWEFSYPMFVSVVTFGALLSQIGTSALTITNLILAFQTGFFWQTLLATKQAKA